MFLLPPANAGFDSTDEELPPKRNAFDDFMAGVGEVTLEEAVDAGI
jgi:hypothetical protein